MTSHDESELDAVFEKYRIAFPDMEAGALFMPTLWQKIEARHSFWPVFHGLARGVMAACAALALVLLGLNFASPQPRSPLSPSYTDALVADHSAEQTYYAETVGRHVQP